MSSVKALVRNLCRPFVSDAIVVPYVSFWAWLVRVIRKPRIIGVTGSVGKTTTTEMMHAVLSQEAAIARIGPVGHALKNMNDDIGLPLSLLRYEYWLSASPPKKLAKLLIIPFRAFRLAFFASYPRLLVLEYGTHWKGHLHRLVKLAPPDISVVTTIGPAHLERLRTLEGVVHEKGALVQATPASGLVVLGGGHGHVESLRRLARAPVVVVEGRGLGLAENIVRVLCTHLGLSSEVIEQGLSKFQPPRRRLQAFEAGGMTVIDDSYNANPMSMELGLDTLSEVALPGQRRVAILGHMAELGDEAVRYHREIAAYARSRCDLLIGVGEPSKDYQPDHWFEKSSECVRHLPSLVAAGDRILVKGSASAEMWLVSDRLRDHNPQVENAAANG